MAVQVVNGAQIMCSFGMAPSALTVLPMNRVMSGGQPAANIQDFQPMVNIAPFGMCTTPSNPQVAAATSAAMGVLTPVPCMPVTTPWTPGSPTVMIGGQPAVTSSSQCQCTWGGMITVVMPGQVTTMTA
jgi:hypothetical protein